MLRRGDRQLAAAIAESRGAMPAWGTGKGGYLEESDIKAIVAYLKDTASRRKDQNPPPIESHETE